MVQPINLIFRHWQQKARLSIVLFDNKDMRIEGTILGFDEYMNIVLDDAEEVYVRKQRDRAPLGRIMLKGDNITMIALATPPSSHSSSTTAGQEQEGAQPMET